MIRARPFDFPYDGKLVPQRTAILVIDLQADFLSPRGYMASRGFDVSPLRAILPAVNRVTKAARSAGCLVVHTRQGYRGDFADMTDFERWRRKRAGLEGTDALLRSGTGFQIDPEVDVEASDIIVDKTCNGAFTHTELEHVLRSREITHLILCGATTEVCVHSTLREACDRNFLCLTIEDACASGDPEMHSAAIRMVTVEDGIFGAVSSSDEVVKGLRRLPGRTAA